MKCKPDDKIHVVVGNSDLYGWEGVLAQIRVRFDRCPNGIFEQFRKDVVERELDVGEGGIIVSGELDPGSLPVLVLCQSSHKICPFFNHVFESHREVYYPDVVRLKGRNCENK